VEVYFIWIAGLVALLISAIIDRKKTLHALKVGWKRLAGMLPVFFEMVVLVSVALTLVPRETIIRYAGGSGFLPSLLAALFGSLTMMPGFVAFPLSGMLLERGASYMTLAAFTTTLMMVGFVTFPVERQYLGTRLAVIRNIIQGLGIALVVSVAIGLAYGELL